MVMLEDTTYLHDAPGTYTHRTLEAHVVRHVRDSGLTVEDGWSVYVSPEEAAHLTPGTQVAVETTGGSGWGARVVGLCVGGRWLRERTDAELETEHAARAAELERRRVEHAAAEKRNAPARDAALDALPDWLREYARADVSYIPDGKWMGKDYRTVAYGLVPLYAEMGDAVRDADRVLDVKDSPAVTTYASEHGTSGNQHVFALALAQRYLRTGSLT